MNVALIFLLASPLIAGVLAPYLLCRIATRAQDPSVRRKLLLVALPFSALFSLVIAVALIEGEHFLTALSIVALLAAFALFISSIFLLLAAAGIPAPLCQVLSSLAVILMMGTIFYLDPLIDHADRNGGGEAVHSCIDRALEWNPYVLIGGSILGVDPIKGNNKILYERSTLSYYRFSYPSWWKRTLWYGALSFGLLGVAAGVKRARKAING